MNLILNKKINKLVENTQPFELEQEKNRIRDVLDIVKDIEYGFISTKDGSRITDRDWIHSHNISTVYQTNKNPLVTINNKLGICKDQSLAIKYLMNKFHPEDQVYLYALTTDIQGHCVPCYCHNNKWYYIENSWDKEKGLHGYFDSKDELEDYLNYVYFENHKDDNNLAGPQDVSITQVNKNELLQEDTRSQLNAASRNAGLYTGDTSRGKNRFERKKFSKVATQVKSYNQIDMNQFFRQDLLEIKIPVTGETNTYTVTIRLNGVVAEIAKNIKNNQNKFEYRTVLQAITKIFNTTNIYVHCTCDDFKYRFDHWSVVNNYGVTDSAHDPGPGKGIANPKNDKGKGCKHILLVLANQDWIMKVTSVIHNYINYAQENMMKPFQKIIFPKLYGIAIDDAIEDNLVPGDTNLESEKHIIEVINDWAKNRGKYKPGTNKNPVTGTGGRQKLNDTNKTNKLSDEKSEVKNN